MKFFATCCIVVVNLVACAPQALAPSKGSNASAAPVQKRAKLDVGFASFEKGMMDHIFATIQKATQASHWSPKLQLGCKNNVTQELSQGLKSQLLPLKQSIGKTWMSLPEDDSKNAYVEQLRSSYEPVFQDVTKTIDSHLERSLKRLAVPLRKPLSEDALMKQCSSTIISNILEEHCYDLGGEHSKKVATPPKKGSFLQQADAAAPKNFCMPSVVEAMIRRLKDSQGLIGMTMQFEAKSMSVLPAAGALDSIVQQASEVSK